MDIMNSIRSIYVGGSTYLNTALETVGRQGVKYDNLIVLSDGDCYRTTGSNSFTFDNYWSGYSTDDNINSLIKKGIIKKVYVNNLVGNDFAIVNTDDYRKNLITGFSEKIVDVINVYSALGTGASDIRVIIDSLMDSLQ